MVQDRYVGDIGDFSNNGLLRAICGTPEKRVAGLKLGVIEYFNEPTSANSGKGDGGKIEYLKFSKNNDSAYLECDEVLYRNLQKRVGKSLVCKNELKIDPDKARELLPVDERYHCALVNPYQRVEWVKSAIMKIDDANIVFVNPDMGIATSIMCKKANANQKRSTEHIYIDELQEINDSNKSLIIYQHVAQGTGTVEKLTDTTVARLRQELQLGPAQKVWVFRWHRVSSRLYFVVARNQDHKDLIEARLKVFRESQWFKKGHFSKVIV